MIHPGIEPPPPLKCEEVVGYWYWILPNFQSREEDYKLQTKQQKINESYLLESFMLKLILSFTSNIKDFFFRWSFFDTFCSPETESEPKKGSKQNYCVIDNRLYLCEWIFMFDYLYKTRTCLIYMMILLLHIYALKTISHQINDNWFIRVTICIVYKSLIVKQPLLNGG